MTLVSLLTVSTVVAIVYMLAKPQKAKQTKWMQGLTDAQLMVESQGLKSATDYYHREFYGCDFEAYEHGWQSFMYSLQAKLADVDYRAKQCLLKCMTPKQAVINYIQ